MEVAAGMDVVEIRKTFPKLQMLGGVDKRPVIAGGAAVTDELSRHVAPLRASGGFIPMIDHSVPPEITWTGFVSYRQQLESVIKRG
jgi:uroporphyrinogen decarboxylase